MTPSEAGAHLVELRAFFPVNKIEDETLALYALELTDIPPADLATACSALARQETWFPSLASIRAACANAREERIEYARRIDRACADRASLHRLLARGPLDTLVRLACPPPAARVFDVATLLGARWSQLRLVGDEYEPLELPDGLTVEAWAQQARDKWIAKLTAELRAAEHALSALQAPAPAVQDLRRLPR